MSTAVCNSDLKMLVAMAAMSACGIPCAAQADAEGWNSTATWGETRQVSFDTTEGTWMSVDISPDGKWVVFDLLAHVYRVPAEGGVAENLTQNSGAALNFHPRYSPDGSSIAFISDRGGQNALWTMGADGRDPERIFEDEVSRISDPKWTADGRGIVAVRSFPTYSFERQSARLWYFAVDASNAAYELSGSPSGKQAYWPSPDRQGRYVYYQFATFGEPFDGLQRRQHVRRLDLSSGEDIAITASPELRKYWADPPVELAPEVSPDGRWLAFARRIPGGRLAYREHTYAQRTALWLRDLRSGEERILMDPITPDMAGAHGTKNLRVLPGYGWAADSRSLVLSYNGGLRRVWLDDGGIENIPFKAEVNRRLSQMTRATHRLSDRPFRARALSWPSVTADGGTAVVEAVGHIWRVDLGTGKSRRLTGNGEEVYEYMPQISPDGQWVAFVTWNAAHEGAVWKAPLAGGAPVALTPRDEDGNRAQYLHPVWSPDGSVLVAVRDKATSVAGRDGGQARQFESIRISAQGDRPIAAISEMPAPVRQSFGPAGKLFMAVPHSVANLQFLLSQGLPVPRQFTSLHAADPSGRYGHAAAAELPLADEAALSPSGRWLAFRRNGNAYVADLQASADGYVWRAGSAPIVLDENPSDPRIRRISERGGYHLRWTGPSQLIFLSGSALHTHDAASGKTQSVDIDITVPTTVPQGMLALTGARLITLAKDGVIESGSILIRGSRIACVGDCRIPAGVRTIDLDGKTIVPGYTDVHAHHLDDGEILSRQRSKSASYLAHGVTTTLDPYVFGDAGFRIAELIDAGRMVGPRTFSTGPALHPIAPDRGVRDYAHAVDEVMRLKAAGAISVKNFLQPLRSQRQMLGKAALASGMTLTNEGADLYYNIGTVIDGSTGFEHPMMYVGTFDDVAQFFGRAGAVYSPTLTVGGAGLWAEDYLQGESDLWNSSKERRFLPWRRLMRTIHPARLPLAEYSFPLLAETVADIKRAGGRIALGGHGEQAGLDTLWEMAVYAQALSPLEVLEAASTGGAFMAGMEKQIGTLESGKFADLVVLDSDPLADIRHVADIAYVMKGGVLYDDDTLDELWPERRPYGTPSWLYEPVYEASDQQYRLGH
jgi:Tol biopolymer transport system component